MPGWIRIYLILVTILAALFSILAYVNPGMQFATWEALGVAGATSLAGPLGLYVARNLATVATGVFALTNGSIPAMMAAFILRAVTDGLDAIHNGLAGNLPGAGFAAVMFVVEVFALVKLRTVQLQK